MLLERAACIRGSVQIWIFNISDRASHGCVKRHYKCWDRNKLTGALPSLHPYQYGVRFLGSNASLYAATLQNELLQKSALNGPSFLK